MDPAALVEAIRAENRTELSRLGSSKTLYADTEGEMEPAAVLGAAADSHYFAADQFEGWADEHDSFTAPADREREHYDAIVGELESHELGQRPAVLESLRGQDDAIGRLGGLIAWTLVAEETAGQTTGFFTGQADPQTASLFRGFGEDYEASRADALDALEARSVGSDDWDRAEAAASAAIAAAYDEYFETLEELGVNPKPVC
jgi:hypothetical protein